MNKEEFIKKFSKIEDTLEDEFRAEFNSPELIWEALKEQLNTPLVICAKAKNKPTPLNWLLRYKLGVKKGATYIEPKLTVRQCASWISEYVKKHCA